MRLPKVIWQLLRSKRFQRVLMAAPFIGIIGVSAYYWQANRWGEEQLETTRERMRELGIPLEEADLEALHSDGRGDLGEQDAFLGMGQTRIKQVLQDAGVPAFDEWWSFLGGTDSHRAGDLRILFPGAPEDQSNQMLAAGLLKSLRTLPPELHEAMELMHDETLRLPYSYSDRDYRTAENIRNLTWILISRGALQTQSGNAEAAVTDYERSLEIAKRQLSNRNSLVTSLSGYGTINAALTATPLFLEACRDRPEQLERIAEALAGIDVMRPALLGLETDLGFVLRESTSILGTGTTLSWEQMDWDIDWDGGLDEWRETLGDWWWQIRPVGFAKADTAAIIRVHLDELTRREDENLNHEVRFQDSKSCFEKLEAFSNSGMSRLGIYGLASVIESIMVEELELNFVRLAAAAELHRARFGAFPDRIAELAKQLPGKSPVSRYTGSPITMSVLPDGRLKFMADGPEPNDPYEFEYPPPPPEQP